MPRKSDPARPPGPHTAQDASAPRPVRTQPVAQRIFLTFYNLISAVLWAVVLERTVLVYLYQGPWKVYFVVGQWLTVTQTLAVSEVLFSLVGLVRAPLLTTLMQVASRLFLVWGVVARYTSDSAFSPVHSSMLVAWSVTEVIRYSFFACSLGLGDVPSWLLWLRYNTFFVLYPIGISSECWLVVQTISAAFADHKAIGWLWVAVLAIYVPGSYILYTHMMAQRRKVLRAARADKVKKTS